MYTDRRNFMYSLSATLGTVAFNGMLQAEERRNAPMAVRPGHLPAKAQAVIFIFFEGGASHIDTFDPKPALDKLHLKEFSRNEKFASAMSGGKRFFIRSPFEFKQCGQSGLWMNTLFENLAGVADDLCIYKGCVADSVNHPTACYHMNTGSQFGGDPAVGAWTTYGLGSLNQDLPGFVVLPELNYPQGGAANWSNGYLPAYYQGTALRAAGAPILDLQPPNGVTPALQRQNLELLASLNREHQGLHPQHEELGARMSAYELAFRMQAQVPGIIDIDREDPAIQEMYGLNDPQTASFGRRCLLARRLVEKGVRFVQIYSGGWDSHDDIKTAHGARIRVTDRGVAALIKDLKSRGMLESTLIVCAGEFGRSPDNGLRGGAAAAGRDHNAKAMNILLAGGGVRAGCEVGATDEIGEKAAMAVHPIKDLHVTLLHLLGLDDNKLTFFHGGRFKQLSQTGGHLIGEIIA